MTTFYFHDVEANITCVAEEMSTIPAQGDHIYIDDENMIQGGFWGGIYKVICVSHIYTKRVVVIHVSFATDSVPIDSFNSFRDLNVV